MLDREQAWNILCEFTKSEGLRKHALAVETCVAAYARKVRRGRSSGGPSPRCCTISIGRFTPRSKSIPKRASRSWRERGVDEEMRRAILSHANHTGVPRQSPLEKTLFACDELAGFITAISYVKPHRSVFEVDVLIGEEKDEGQGLRALGEPPGHRRRRGELGVPLDEHIDFCIKAMQARAEELGLKGSL